MKSTILGILCAILLFVDSSFSQSNYQYDVKVDTIQLSSSKALFDEIRSSLIHSHVRITGDKSFSFRSTERYSAADMNDLLNPLGSELSSLTKIIVGESSEDNFEKNGGQDCPDASMVCSNNSFSGNASGSGNTQELNAANDGCLSIEHQSSWYYINVDTPGSLEMTISPDDPTDDYDFALWGPFTSSTAAANCPPTSAPVRCSWSADDGDTGIGSYWGCVSYHWFWGYCTGYGWLTPTDNSEGSGGDKWVAPLNVNAGEVYILLIDNYSTSSQPFDLAWDGTAGLDCTTVPLPVELISFEGQNQGVENVLSWTTASEKNNDYFTLQHSTNGVDWTNIEDIPGAGTTSEMQFYSTTHRDFDAEINYYRLIQVDYDGTITQHKTISIDNTDAKELIKRVNMLGQEVGMDYRGIVIEYYKDGTIRKYFNNPE